jgi:hypothetical protein
MLAHSHLRQSATLARPCQHQCRHLPHLELFEGRWMDDRRHVSGTHELSDFLTHAGERIPLESAQDQHGAGFLRLADDSLQGFLRQRKRDEDHQLRFVLARR